MATIDPFSSATDLMAALDAREVSSVELLEMYIGRVERLDGMTNAVVVRDFDRARTAAKDADERRARGGRGALLGLPMTVKESYNVDGLITTCGLPENRDARVSWDAPAVQRMKAAGAVIFGKTNVPPHLADWQSENVIYGRSNNPWDLGRSPGGSSGGSAAALAAGLTGLEYGSDIGGSIRVPASFCGLYGHRPSDSALPRSGQFPVPNLVNSATAMGVQGPMGRSAKDLELLFNVVAGPDVGEDAGWKLDIRPPRHQRLADFRVAVMPWHDWLPVDPDIAAGTEALAERLSEHGATVARAQPEALVDLQRHQEHYATLLNAMMTARLPKAARDAMATPASPDEDPFITASRAGASLDAAGYIGLFAERERYRASYREFFMEWDILLAPCSIAPAFEHRGLGSINDWTLEVGGQTVPYPRQVVYPGIATLSGQPATAFLAGFTTGGLPFGLQAIGPYLEDRTPMHFATLVEREFGGFQRPPGFDA